MLQKNNKDYDDNESEVTEFTQIEFIYLQFKHDSKIIQVFYIGCDNVKNTNDILSGFNKKYFCILVQFNSSFILYQAITVK